MTNAVFKFSAAAHGDLFAHMDDASEPGDSSVPR